MNVYVVTSGQYSNYHIEAIYERREDAEACARRIHDGPGGEAEVEEWPLYPKGDDSFQKQPIHTAYAVVSPDGVIGEVGGFTDFVTGTEPVPLQVNQPRRFWRQGYEVSALAGTGEAAVKATKERAARVAALIAEGVDPLGVEWG